VETNRRPTEAPKKEQQRTDQRSFAILMKGLLAFLNGLASDWHPLGTEWQLTKTQRFWIVRIAIVLVFLLAIGYAYDKTLWNWMQLLIVPAVLAAGGYLFARAENRRTERSAQQRAQDEALQAYLGEMGSLMLEKGLGSSQANATCVPQYNSQVPTLAQARTLTVVRILGPGGKRSVLDFLYESKLIGGSGPAIVKLGGSDSHGGAANLSGADLEAAHLPGADLMGAILTGANLREANLREAILSGAYLNDADLSRADLRKANLRHADLSMATLTSADLTDTDLTGADLGGAEGIRCQQTEQTESLDGAIMPDGQKYEDWRKDKEGSGKDVENE
jgi:Pentapeptide repeats (8 copies)